MSRKEDPDPIAAAMVQKRWDKTPAKERSEQARKMAEARWGPGYVAKRPASSRNTGKPRGRAEEGSSDAPWTAAFVA